MAAANPAGATTPSGPKPSLLVRALLGGKTTAILGDNTAEIVGVVVGFDSGDCILVGELNEDGFYFAAVSAPLNAALETQPTITTREPFPAANVLPKFIGCPPCSTCEFLADKSLA